MGEHKPGDEEQRPPPDELQQRAHSVWRSLKILFFVALLIIIAVAGLAGFLLFHAFGFTGLLIGAVVLVVGIALLCWRLMTY